MFILSQPDPDFYKIFSSLFIILAILLMFATMIFGREINGAKRWLNFGFLPYKPQK